MVANFNKKATAAAVIFFLIIAVLIFADIKIYQKKQELISQISSYKKQIEDIKKNSQNLKNEIANSNNKDYLEKIAYEQLGQQKPGEKEVIFVAPPAQPVVAVKQESFWDKFLIWIKSKF